MSTSNHLTIFVRSIRLAALDLHSDRIVYDWLCWCLSLDGEYDYCFSVLVKADIEFMRNI